MILPWPFFSIPGMTALAQTKGPIRSMSTTCRKSSTDISVMGMRLMMPALLTRMSTPPRALSRLAWERQLNAMFAPALARASAMAKPMP